ncbi:SusC/RagA family TonB-linked outer membrane protein [Paenimyroides tangerinum]|uniref:SusC/RagA family TonB-linked outer membrane protein n=1 Tax=Paenimyroides tangerinum TaxID=2488728 RepID=A0A3P3WDE4_9FLAO|nr:SusC/RagA family TonB-linked outer membrane protein [Paenimyroides tangerinum]RRJ93080.1 SusC/RagA family TonB-linked outer membrane protein [Paenimyroides tangerinum]
MKSKFTWILLLLSVLTFQFSFAQTKVVTGTVTSKDYGDPIQGATVLVEGTTRGVDTDENGKYSINAAQGEKLVVRLLGLKTQKATVGVSNVLNFSMIIEDDLVLDEIVVDAYRTVSKPKSAVAASTVTAKTIEGRPNASFVQTLQSQVPGLEISTGSGQPGSSNTSVLLRGAGSINGNTEPLFVIDGVPMGNSSFRSINPNDIESITVLKDAGATSIYGNRGANGVIVVTTKGASFESDLQIKYVGTTSVSRLQKNNYDLMGGKELMDFEMANGFNNYSASLQKTAAETNWLDVFFRTAITQNHTLSFTRGSKNLASFTSIGYTDQEGILINTDLKRFNFRNNLNGKSNDGRLTYGTNITANYSKSRIAQGLGTGSVNNNYVVGALQGAPYINPDSYNGSHQSIWNQLTSSSFVSGSILKASPLLLMDKAKWFDFNQEELKMIAQGNVNYKLTDDLSVGTSLGVDYTHITQNGYDSPYSFNSWFFSPDRNDESIFVGSASQINQRVVSFNSLTNMKWAKTFNDVHEVKAGVFMEYLKAHFKSSSLAQEGLDRYFSSPNSGAGWISDTDANDYYVPSVGMSVANAGLFSYFANASYDYDTRYGVEATVRRDASFRFANSNRWGTFYSVSARWNISNEEFMQESVFDDLKLRGSYGTAGNQDITGSGLFGGASLFRDLYSVGGGYNNNPSLVISNIANPNLKWETVEQANIGLDFGIWQSRLRGTLDVYQKTTKDLYQSQPISAIYGTSSIFANVGSMRNRGIELLLAADVVRNDNFKFTINVNGSYNKNEIVKLPNSDGIIWNGGGNIMREGDMLGQYYMVEYAGVNPANGNLWFYDKDGNMTETPTDEDRKFTGKSAYPLYQGGFGFDADYKGFFLSTQFSFVQNMWRVDNDYRDFLTTADIGTFNKSRELHDSWTPTNTDAKYPSLNNTNEFYQTISDRSLRDASYVRLRYITLGYNFTAKNLAPLKLSGLRIYAQAENLITWTKWKGFDAESNRGSDFAQYPTPKTVSFGVEVQF